MVFPEGRREGRRHTLLCKACPSRSLQLNDNLKMAVREDVSDLLNAKIRTYKRSTLQGMISF